MIQGLPRFALSQVHLHPFFEQMDWEKLAKRELPPPYQAHYESHLDTSAFDNVSELQWRAHDLVQHPDKLVPEWVFKEW